jgi:uncharacterized protein (DUF3084 family)
VLFRSREAELEHRERRLAELGVDDISGQPRIDHLIRQLDRAEAVLARVRTEAREELAAAHEQARELQERVKGLEDAEHRRLLTQADLARREAGIAARQRELRDEDEKRRRQAQELDARQQGLLAHERRLAERERRVDASEADVRRRIAALERREREVEEREHMLHQRDTGWWNAGPASSRF